MLPENFTPHQQHKSEFSLFVSKVHFFVQGAWQSGILMFFNVRLEWQTMSHKLDSLQNPTYSPLNKPHHPWKMRLSRTNQAKDWTTDFNTTILLILEWTSDHPSYSCNILLTFHFSSKAWIVTLCHQEGGNLKPNPTSKKKYPTPAWFAWHINVSRNFCNVIV